MLSLGSKSAPARRRFSLAAKISALAISVVLAAAAGLSLFMVQLEKRSYFRDLLNHGMTIADATAQNCEYGVYTEDVATLNLVFTGLAADTDIVYAAVVNAKGKVIAQSVFRQELALPADLQYEQTGPGRAQHAEFESERDGKRYLDIRYPIAMNVSGVADPVLQDAVRQEPKVIGQVRLGLSQERLDRKIRDMALSTGLFTVFLVFLGSVLSVILSRRITLPLARLQDATQLIARGEFERPIEVTTSDEISDLAGSFDYMRHSLRTYQERMQHDAFHDVLTGLPNRSLFGERLQRAITRAKRESAFRYGVLVVDLDNFKVINDSLGHAVGDLLIVECAERLLTCVRPDDTVARFGGDEFAVLLEDISGEGNALFVASRIKAELAKSFTMKGREVYVTASMGIALTSGNYDQADQVLRDADTALYRAKAQNRSDYCVFEPAMHENAVERLHLETDMRRAVERREFVAYYQPILSVATKRIAGFEALARWYHMERGVIAPGSFVPLAEETGLIVSLERAILRQACLQMKRWLELFPGNRLRFMSVNLAHKQLRQPDLVEVIQGILRDTGLPPEHLKLEITENVLFEDPEAAVTVLLRLRDLGVKLYIDDFGTGYSSLSYLHRLPIDGLKIDRSFITRIDNADENRAIIKSIVSLARDMNIEVVAEGVETANQLAHVEQLACTYWQGFFFSKPQNSDDAERLIGG